MIGERGLKATKGPSVNSSWLLKVTWPHSSQLGGANSSKVYFCLRPLAKDQGITWVVVVVLVHHLVHFLSKRNLSKKNLPDWKLNWGLQIHSQALYPLSNCLIVTQIVKIYLFNLRMSKTMPQTLDQYWSTLVSRWANPGPFLFSSLWTGNWSSQQDSNRAHQSRRREHWPLDHHHGQIQGLLRLP